MSIRALEKTSGSEMRQQLMETTIQLIWQSSYANVGVAEVCKKAGVTKGCFYHHFESKADLFYESSLYYWEGMKHDLDRIFSPSFSAQERLDNLIEFVIEKQNNEEYSDGKSVSGCPFFTSAAQVGSGEDKIRQAAQEMIAKANDYNRALVIALQADGVVSGEVNPDQLARLVYQFMMGLLLYGRVMQDLELVKADIATGIYRLLGMKKMK